MPIKDQDGRIVGQYQRICLPGVEWFCDSALAVIHLSKARCTRELSAYDKVHSCNLPYAKTSRVRATFGKVLFIRAKNLSKVNVVRTREVFS